MEAIDLVKQTCASRGIDADITGGGEVRLAHRPGRAKLLRDDRRAMYELVGLDGTFLDNAALAARGLAAAGFHGGLELPLGRSEEHTSELQSLMRISYAVFCLNKKKTQLINTYNHNHNSNNTIEIIT